MSETETLATEMELDQRRAEVASWLLARRQQLAERLTPHEADSLDGQRNRALLERLDRLNSDDLSESSHLIWEEYRSAAAIPTHNDLDEAKEAYTALTHVESALRDLQVGTGADAEFAALLREVVVKEAIDVKNLIRHWNDESFRRAA